MLNWNQIKKVCGYETTSMTKGKFVQMRAAMVNGKVKIVTDRKEVEPRYTREEIEERVNQLINSVQVADKNTAPSIVARTSKRGNGVKLRGQPLFYHKGSSPVDAGLIIVEFEGGRYDIYQPDNWSDFYCRVEET